MHGPQGETLSGQMFALGNQLENENEWTETKYHLSSSLPWESSHKDHWMLTCGPVLMHCGENTVLQAAQIQEPKTSF